jgi:hypothetical protein
MFMLLPVLIVLLFLSLLVFIVSNQEYEGKVVKGNRNGLYLVDKGTKRLFPDFNTFVKMGYDAKDAIKIPDATLEAIAMGAPIIPIPVFRPEDRMYHSHCDDPDRLVSFVYQNPDDPFNDSF